MALAVSASAAAAAVGVKLIVRDELTRASGVLAADRTLQAMPSAPTDTQ